LHWHGKVSSRRISSLIIVRARPDDRNASSWLASSLAQRM
jgi:hypothetical protein